MKRDRECFLRATVDIWDITAQVIGSKQKAVNDLGYSNYGFTFMHDCPLCELCKRKKATITSTKNCNKCPLKSLWELNSNPYYPGAICERQGSAYVRWKKCKTFKNHYDASFFAQLIADEAYSKLGGNNG